MKSIGIKLADGSFYPVMEDGKSGSKTLQLTTVKDNQTTVKVDLYQSETGSMEDAEYLDTLQIEDLNPHPNGEPDFNLSIALDDDNNLSAQVNDPETNRSASKDVPFIKRSADERAATSPIVQADDITNIDLNDFDEVSDSNDFESPKIENSPLENEVESANDTSDIPDLDDLDLSGIEEEKAGDEDESATAENEDNANNTPETEPQEIDDFDLSSIENDDSENDEPAESADLALENEVESANDTSDISDLDDLDLSGIEEEKAGDEDESATAENKDNANNTPETEPQEIDDFDLSSIENDDSENDEPAERAGLALENEVESANDASDIPDLDDLDLSGIEEEKADNAPKTSFPETEDVNLSDFGIENTDEPIVEKVPVRDATESDSAIPEAEDEQKEEDDGISLDITTSIPVEEEIDFNLPDMDEPSFEQPAENKKDDLSLDLPDDLSDFDSESSDSDKISADSSNDSNFDIDSLNLDGNFSASENTVASSDFDFNDAENKSEASDSFDIGNSENSSNIGFDMGDDSFGSSDSLDFSDLNSNSESGTVVSDSGLDLSDLDNDPAFNTQDFDVPDFDEQKTSSFSFDDDFNDPAFALPESNGVHYEESSYDSSDSDYRQEKHSRGVSVAAAICVICAIICLLATALALFVLPSNLNMQNLLHPSQDAAVVPSVEDAKNTVENEHSVAPKAQENAIVVSEIAEVVPEKTAVLSEITEDVGEDGEKKEVEGSRYIARWGDVLWDIANSYYRNPWLYPRIAKYNNIPDPDFIESGTPLIIPK